MSALGVLWPPRSHQLLSVCRQRHGFWGSDLTSPPDAAPCHAGRGGCRALLLCRDGRGPRLPQEVSPCLALVPPTPLWSAPGGCTVWVRAGVLPGGRARRSVQLSLQRGPPGPGDGAAVLRLPCEHEGLGEWPPLWARGRGALAGLCHAAPRPCSLCCSPPWSPCHPTSCPRPSSAARGTACSPGRGSTGFLPRVGSYRVVPPGPRSSRGSESTCWGTAKTRPGLARAELADQRLGQETPPGAGRQARPGRRRVIARLYK